VERLPGRTTAGAVWLVVIAGKSRVEIRMKKNGPAECLAMKRPGKPDTGNPSVRFDVGRSDIAARTTAVSSIRLPSLRLLYHYHLPSTGICFVRLGGSR
jgi:hypothetical protein